MYEKLANIMSLSDVGMDEYEHSMDKWDDELKDFMIAAENKCRTFKNSNLEWSPTVRMWVARRWVLTRLQKFIAKTKSWSMSRYQNLRRSCRRHGIKGPGLITQDERNVERNMFKQKLKELENLAPCLRI